MITGKAGRHDTVSAARKDHGDPGSHGAIVDHKRTIAPDDRAVSNLDAGHIGDGIEWAWFAFKGNPEVSGAGGHPVVPVDVAGRQDTRFRV